MAALITIAIVVAVTGVLCGAYIKICLAIRREDRVKWSLRSAPPTSSTQTARSLVGIKGSRWN
jgi:hypothetical protein